MNWRILSPTLFVKNPANVRVFDVRFHCYYGERIPVEVADIDQLVFISNGGRVLTT
jgi:hypothetical protein